MLFRSMARSMREKASARSWPRAVKVAITGSTAPSTTSPSRRLESTRTPVPTGWASASTVPPEAAKAASGSLAQSTMALWHRIAGPAAQTVRDVARAQGWPWRVLDDGSVWMGPETWDAAEAAELEVLAPDHIEERYAVSGDVFGLRPGTTVLLRGPEGDVGVQVDTVLLRVALAQATATVWGFRG